MKYLDVEPEKVAEMSKYLMGSTYKKAYDNYINRIALNIQCNPSVKKRIETLTYYDGLYDYQIEDVLRMVNCKAFLNRNKPGYGKTIETVMACRNLNARSICIIAPKPTLLQWKKAFIEWWPDRENDVRIVEIGDTLYPGKIWLANPERVVHKEMIGEFQKIHWFVLAVDEAHMIKNRDAKRTVAIKSLIAKYKWALTGTPVLKNPSDLWSILHFLNPEYAGNSYWTFTRYVCDVSMSYFGEQINGLTKDPVKVSYIQELLETVSCYHPERKTQFGKCRIYVPLEMEAAQAKLYKNTSKLVYEEIPEEMTIPNGAVKVLRLMQITSAPSMFGKITGVKFQWIKDFLENNPDTKIVVYSRFEKALSELQRYLKSNKINTVSYTGKMTATAKEKHKEQFITNPEVRAILGTIQAMGVGVDGLQQASHICVFLDKDFIPEINNQCEDRLNRIGQTEEVICYYLDCEKTWDKHVTKTNGMRMSDIKRLIKEGYE